MRPASGDETEHRSRPRSRLEEGGERPTATRTARTRKYQCNASLLYAKAIKKLRASNHLDTDGAAIRMVLEAGLAALSFEKLVEEAQAERSESEEA